MQTIRTTTELVRSPGRFESQTRDGVKHTAEIRPANDPLTLPTHPAFVTIYHPRLGEAPTLVGGTAAGTMLDVSVPVLTVYIQSVAGADGGVLACDTANPSPTPATDLNHIMSFQALAAAAAEGVAITMQLRQGYSNETDDLGTFIAALDSGALTTGATKYRKRLTTAQAALITDYTDLQFRFLFKRLRDGGGAATTARLLQAQLELPEAQDITSVQLTPAEDAKLKRGESITV